MKIKICFQIEWRTQDGKLLLGSQNSSSSKVLKKKTYLTISVIHFIPRRSQDGQSITCSATNSVSPQEKTSQVVLKLIYKPEVKITQTNKLSSKEGEDLQFRCNSQAKPPVTEISWSVNGKHLAQESSPVLTLTSVSRDHHGAIVQCVARNVVGEGMAQTKVHIKCK